MSNHLKNYLNRELSWLAFNQRVLGEALDVRNPLFERLKFLCIASSNLDEFFEVRVSSLKQQMEADAVERSLDGRTATETFHAVRARVLVMVDEFYRCWHEELQPGLARHGFQFHSVADLATDDRQWAEHYYHTHVRPVLTPLAVDLSHSFPLLLNKSLNLIVQVEREQDNEVEHRLVIVQVPRVLPRIVPLKSDPTFRNHIFLADLISHFIADLFPGTRVHGCWPFRVTRNSELYIDEDDADNLLQAVENELRNRRKGDAVRLEIDQHCPESLVADLLGHLGLSTEDHYGIRGPLNLTRLMAVCQGDHSPELRDQPFVAPISPALQDRSDLFAAIRERDILLHHPYDSFESVIDFLNQAAADPSVLAIKQTLYRTGGDPRIVGALMLAAQNGKQVAAIVELKARFDEARNIRWARELEQAGVNVSFGLVGFKIHAKLCLIVRQEDDRIRHYLHLSTGNYNPTTARTYTDYSLLTTHPELAEDAAALFNQLTGFCQFQKMRKLIVAPFEYHQRVIDLIRAETKNARDGKPARITAKMNSLVDKPVINALYDASMAGVKIDLIVRGICCLRPGVPKLSENISVRSIVDRFLEHGRVFCFENGGTPAIFISSGDWMYRNFERRIEVAFPIVDPTIHHRITDEILAIQLADNTKSHSLLPDGSYELSALKAGEKPVNAQQEFMKIALQPPNRKSAPSNKRRTARRRPSASSLVRIARAPEPAMPHQ